MNGLVQGIGPCTFETNWEIAQFRVSPAPDQSPASTGAGKVSQTRPCGFGPPGSYIGTVLSVYAAAGSTRTNDVIDNSRPCDHNRKLCESSHITPKFVT